MTDDGLECSKSITIESNTDQNYNHLIFIFCICGPFDISITNLCKCRHDPIYGCDVQTSKIKQLVACLFIVPYPASLILNVLHKSDIDPEVCNYMAQEDENHDKSLSVQNHFDLLIVQIVVEHIIDDIVDYLLVIIQPP